MPRSEASTLTGCCMSRDSFFRAVRALLPTGRAWDITQPTGLRRVFEAIVPLPQDIRKELEGVYQDYFPDTTCALEKWEEIFHVRFSASLFTDGERRIVLKVLWLLRYGNTTGEFMRSVLDVFIPGVRVTDNVPVGNALGLIFAYKSVNGNKYMCCGNRRAMCNFHVGDRNWYPAILQNDSMKAYNEIPNTAAYWPMFFFVSGEVFRDGDRKFIAFARKKVHEKWQRFVEYVVLALKPVQSTAIMFIQYVPNDADTSDVTDLGPGGDNYELVQ